MFEWKKKCKQQHEDLRSKFPNNSKFLEKFQISLKIFKFSEYVKKNQKSQQRLEIERNGQKLQMQIITVTRNCLNKCDNNKKFHPPSEGY